MKNRVISGFLGFIALGATTLIAQAAGTAEKAVAALEEQWTQSMKTNNPDLMAPLIADKYIGIGLDGKIGNREQTMADAKLIKYTSVVIKEFHVAVTGHTAVATMVFQAKGTDEKGLAMNLNARWADTWVKMPNGGWQCILSQGTQLQ